VSLYAHEAFQKLPEITTHFSKPIKGSPLFSKAARECQYIHPTNSKKSTKENPRKNSANRENFLKTQMRFKS